MDISIHIIYSYGHNGYFVCGYADPAASAIPVSPFPVSISQNEKTADLYFRKFFFVFHLQCSS